MEDSIQLKEIYLAINSNQPMSPEAQSHLNTTIDLTGSPDTPHLVSCQNPVPNSRNQLSISSLSSTSIAPSSPAPQSIQCPVCLESLSSIRRNGYHLLSTTCGHIFCLSVSG
eukprot:GFUD01108469.1.p1 GENE.GFUD01108469.1~~GFUD01108469.1.p1  ORF type:complete len:112 (-),score=28.67 GFUD01108469.1:23-358(-)